MKKRRAMKQEPLFKETRNQRSSRSVFLRMTPNERTELDERARNLRMSLNSYVLSVLFPKGT